VLLLRFLLILAALVLVFSVGLYFLARDPKYLRFSWQLIRLVGLALLVFGLLFLLERYVLVGWRVFL
jgi:hypothetical protein